MNPPKPPFGTPLNKLATRTVPTAREAEVFRLKALSMELWWNDTDRGKASTRRKGVVVPLGPPQTFMDIPKAQVPLSTTGHQRQKLQVGG